MSDYEVETLNGPLLPVGTFVGWLMGEFLGDAARVCVWKIDPSMGPRRVEKAWNVEVTSGFGRFENLLGQGKELGYPVSMGVGPQCEVAPLVCFFEFPAP